MRPIEPASPQQVHLSLPLTRPVLVWGVLGINVLVFAAETLLGGSDNSATLIRLGAKVNVLIALGDYWRLVTPMFLHIGVMHLLVNSYALYALGPEVEALFGRARFLSIYLLSGVAGNVMSYAFTPNLSAGASTAIFGLVGAEMVFFYRQREKLGAFGQRRLINILSIVAINLLIGVSSGAVDNFGHAGGFIGGILLGWLLCPDYQVEYGLDGQPQIQDRNSLLRELPGLVLFIMLLIVAAGAITLQEVQQPQVKLERGVQKLAREDYASALPLIEQAAHEMPTSQRAQYLLAVNYYALERYGDAAQAFEATLQIAPDLSDAYFYLGLSYLQLDRRTEARTNLQRFLALESTGERADHARQLVATLQ